MKKLIKEYRVELIAIAITALGIFLLVERLDIRATIRKWLDGLISAFKVFAQTAPAVIAGYISRFTISDMIGWVLVLGASIFVLWRIRYRFANASRWLSNACPKCGEPLHLIHRKPFQRLLSNTLLPGARHFRCSSDSCDWSGLRRRQKYREKIDDHVPFG